MVLNCHGWVSAAGIWQPENMEFCKWIQLQQREGGRNPLPRLQTPTEVGSQVLLLHHHQTEIVAHYMKHAHSKATTNQPGVRERCSRMPRTLFTFAVVWHHVLPLMSNPNAPVCTPISVSWHFPSSCKSHTFSLDMYGLTVTHRMVC